MKFLSICSGIEAASVAWKPLGWEPVGFSEIEPFPSAVLKHHYPEVINFGDMTKLPEQIRLGMVELPDLLCGGTPCQAFSVAGLRKSLDDARGNLTLTFCEIANAIDDERTVAGLDPCIVFWENVPGVLNTKDNAFGCFLAALAGEARVLEPAGGKWTNAGCVYGPQRAVAWRILDAQYFGVAQRRRRVFVVASARDGFDPAKVLFEFDGVRRDSAPSRKAGKVAPTIPSRSTAGGGLGTDFDCDGGGVAHAFKVRGGVEREDGSRGSQNIGKQAGKGYLGSDDVASTITKNTGAGGETQNPAFVAQPIGFNARQDPDAWQDRTGPLDTDGGTQAVGVTIHGTDGTARVASFTETSSALRSRIPSGVENSTTTAVMQPVAVNISDGQARLDTVTGTLDCWSAKGRGSSQQQAVMQPVAIHENQRAEVTLNDTAGTVKCAGGKPGQGYPAAMVGMQVRRLTPTECERLQGFPDGYTNIPWRNKPEAPDGPRYKALGNSWAVPCVRWLGERIAQQVAT